MHIQNDPSFFLTNKTGAPQGEKLGAAPGTKSIRNSTCRGGGMLGKSSGNTSGISRTMGFSARDDVQSGLISSVALVTTNNQRLVSEWNTNDLLVTNNDNMVPCQPIHADYNVKTTEFYGHYIDIENGVLVIQEGLSLGVDVRRRGTRVFIIFSFPVYVHTYLVSQTSTLITSGSSLIPSSSSDLIFSGGGGNDESSAAANSVMHASADGDRGVWC
ncbi:hypothetical protein Tco_0823290 [Tanacetum coccineum]|uniref:Uncharacterized protein n=1 Tax=Tanacetum coccineum TaxID=301880 RepID=A0ABQ5AHG8_9ASTR